MDSDSNGCDRLIMSAYIYIYIFPSLYYSALHGKQCGRRAPRVGVLVAQCARPLTSIVLVFKYIKGRIFTFRYYVDMISLIDILSVAMEY